KTMSEDGAASDANKPDGAWPDDTRPDDGTRDDGRFDDARPDEGAFDRPSVASNGRDRSVWLLGGGALILGVAVFAALGVQRGSAAETRALPGLNGPNAVIAAPELPPDLAQLEATAANAAAPPPPFVITTTPPMPIVVTPVAFSQPAADDAALRE